MKDRAGTILYIGKANHLKSRIQQYMNLQDTRAMVPRLVQELETIEFILTNTEKEALLLESQLVKKLRPRYNVMLRDDKSFLIVRIDDEHPFPRLEFVRKRKKDGATYLGPFPSAKTLRAFVRFVSRAYCLRTCSNGQFAQRVRPCVLHQTGFCTAPCVFPEKNEDYRSRVDSAGELLSKRRNDAARLVEKAMLEASEKLRFEDAARYRDLLQSLNMIWSKQRVVVKSRLSADVFAFYQGPLGGGIFVLHLRDSGVTGTRSFFNEGLFAGTQLDVESILFQYYEDNASCERVICRLADGTRKTLQALLTEQHGRKVVVHTPRRGEQKALLALAETNAKQVYERESEKALSRFQLLESVATALDLPAVPGVIECVDISSFQGGDAVGSVAVTRDGTLSKKEYRSFHIKGKTHSDIEMMREVVRRRLRQVQNEPDTRLLLVDGGRAHLAQVLPLFEEVGSQALVGAIAKARPEQGLETDRIYLPGRKLPVPIRNDSRLMHFFQMLRDEAHRFGIAFHRKKRKKRVLSSPLLKIPGIGAKRRADLLRLFGSTEAISKASLATLYAVPGLPKATARNIHEHFHPTGEIDER
jgi:excinuclease ABC subunit C